MKIIENECFPNERDLYASRGVHLRNCRFEGVEDGESALKESADITLEDCYMDLRYPLWHDDRVRLFGVTMTVNCRAALWYSRDITIDGSTFSGIKALRECERARITNTQIISPEFGWKCGGVEMIDCTIESEYAFLLSRDLYLFKVNFKGKYSFQYVEGAFFENCTFDTKDAFWHSKDVTVKNCFVKGEYLGWYSENLIFIDCTIVGTQPLCYCKGLKLINCKMVEADLAFEYSEVEADIKSEVVSIKNPRTGRIACEGVGELIYTDDSVFPCACAIQIKP